MGCSVVGGVERREWRARTCVPFSATHTHPETQTHHALHQCLTISPTYRFSVEDLGNTVGVRRRARRNCAARGGAQGLSTRRVTLIG